MIKEVHKDNVIYNDPPMMLEAGTPGIVQTIGFGVALDYMMGIGFEAIQAHEKTLTDYAQSQLGSLNWLTLQGAAQDKGPIFSFTCRGPRMRMIFRRSWIEKASRCGQASIARDL